MPTRSDPALLWSAWCRAQQLNGQRVGSTTDMIRLNYGPDKTWEPAPFDTLPTAVVFEVCHHSDATHLATLLRRVVSLAIEARVLPLSH